MNASNYPPGSDNSSAPWNERNEPECTTCEGTGKTNVSDCCGAMMDSDILICSDCKEHADCEDCEDCKGTGYEQ